MKAITESRILTIQSKSKREEIPQSSELHKWFGEISISIFHINEEKIILTYVSNPKHSYKDTW